MKKNLFLLLLLPCLFINAQEAKEINLKTEVTEATVFINGAQITRLKSTDLPLGKSIIKFTNLSPYIDAKSVRIKLDGEAMVTSVNHQINFMDTAKVKTPVVTNDKRLEEITDQIGIETANREVLKAEMDFLIANREIGGNNNGVSLASLREVNNYYKERLLALKTEDLARFKKVTALEEEKKALLSGQRQDGGSSKKIPVGEVVVEIECKRPTKVNMELTYYVNNAGWFPTYDIRAINIDKPIELVYKANVHQNTKEEWKNIKLKVSSTDPNLGSVAPKLKTYHLNYYTAPPRYDSQASNSEVKGIIFEMGTNEPLIGAMVTISGTTISTLADPDGSFSLSIPQNATHLKVQYVGFENVTIPISNAPMRIAMKPAELSMDEVVVVGYGTQKKKDLTGAIQGRIAGVSIDHFAPAPASEFARSDIAMPTEQVESQTAVEFEIKIPYTIKSNNKNTMIEVDRYELPANYEYYSVPKVNKDAFLLANIVDWEKYNLLEGEANIFFENTYIGKTVLDMRNASDTLNISLGRDKNVQVNREKVKEYNTKKFLGNKKEETRLWKISVRNNKRQRINMILLDQIPVSSTQEIEVEAENLSGGVLDSNNGEVKWRLELKPADKKEMELKYKIKYPKNKSLTIE